MVSAIQTVFLSLKKLFSVTEIKYHSGLMTRSNRWTFSPQSNVCSSLEQLYFLACFLLVSQIPCESKNIYLCLYSISFPSILPSLCYGLFLSFLPTPCAVVPGYSQVSVGRKDLFCCSGSPVSVGSHGKGWSGSTTHRTGLTTLMCPWSAPLLTTAMRLSRQSDIWCPLNFTIDVMAQNQKIIVYTRRNNERCVSFHP